jgi:hypothetical protein
MLLLRTLVTGISVISACCAAAARDPEFLATLRANVDAMRSHPKLPYLGRDFLDAFAAALDDPEIFVRRRR